VAPTLPAATSVAADPLPAAVEPTTHPTEPWRLPDHVKPVRYQLALDVDPALPGFTGTVAIDVVFDRASSVLVLNGRGLEFQRVTLEDARRVQDATYELRRGYDALAEPDQWVLRVPNPVTGPAQLRIAYRGEFRSDVRGLYRVQVGDAYYAFTQFEARDARSAFPCFDEPSYKVPFATTIRVPAGQKAYSNMPVLAQRELGTVTEFEFEPSPPLPTYLVALAAGPLDAQPAQPWAQATGRPPLQLITTRGKSERGALALQLTQKHLATLEDYFGSPYPYPKLDIVAVPDFGPGAMENAGLVTFREERLLMDAAAPPDEIRGMSLTIAHELAHMWFGDWVTMPWWDEIWLNESFATWMATKTVEATEPQRRAAEGFLGWQSYAMSLDSLATARAIRQPVRTESEGLQAFSSITYAKGAAVLGMVEQWLGVEAFRSGVQRYLGAHAFGTASSSDLFAALGAEGQPVAAVMSSFIDQSGVPEVHVAAGCSADGKILELTLAQRPYQPLGESAVDKRWQIPVCVRFPEGTALRTECTLLTAPQQTHMLSTQACPAWLVPNADQQGYYYSALAPEWSDRLLTASAEALSAREQIGRMMDLGAQLDSGQLQLPEYLRQASALLGVSGTASQTKRRGQSAAVWEPLLYQLARLNDAVLSVDERPSFQRWLRRSLAQPVRQVGLLPKSTDDDATRLLRRTLVMGMGTLGRDSKVLATARQIFTQWLSETTVIPPEVADIFVPIAASLEEPAITAALVKVATTTVHASRRVLALRALNRLTEPSQVESVLDLVLGRRIPVGSYRYVLEPLLRSQRARPAAYEWFARHVEQLKQQLPVVQMRGAMIAALQRCDTSHEAETREFFTASLASVAASNGVLEEALAATAQCAAYQQQHAPGARALWSGP
jgi:cytosol alanyl aminopeptidase